jgi:microcompartment protein CcmK/EutM
MPQAIPIAIMAAIEYGAYYVAAVLIVVQAVMNNSQRKKAERRARDAYNAGLQDRLQMISSATGARSRVYGEVRNVDGVVFKGTHGTNSEFYTLVVALAGHECESIEKVYFNDQELTLSSDGAGGYWVHTEPYLRYTVRSAIASLTTVGTVATVTLPHTPVAGSVKCYQYTGLDPEGLIPQYQIYEPVVAGSLVTCDPVDAAHTTIECEYQYLENTPRARVWKYLGTDSQDIGSDLLASRFPTLINTGTNDDRFAGMCCLVVELQYDQDAFPVGVPNITGLIRGAKIYDPRTGLTAWSQNPAIIARDWSLYAYGGGSSSAEVNEAAIIAAANACDIETDFVTPDGTQTRPLYQCDIVCKLDAPPDQGWLAEIVESMAGKWGWAGGVLTMVAGVYRAPVADITEDWISDAEDISLVKDVPMSDVVNVYRPTIANADAPVATDGTGMTTAYAMAAMPEVRGEAYITADGRELPREVTLGGVVHNVHARHICGVMMRDSRYGMTMQLPCKMHAWALELFDVVTVTLPLFGLAAAQFEVIGWNFSADKGVILTLKQIDASIFDPDASFPLPNSELNTTMVLPWVVEDLTGLTVADATEDGTQQSRMLVSWTAAVSQSVRSNGKVEVQYHAVGTLPTGDWPSWTEEGTATSAIVTGLLNNTYYIVRARFINTLGVRGPWSTQKLHQVGVPLIDTPQLEPGAATVVYVDTDASESIVPLTDYVPVSRSLPEAGTYEITATARYQVTSFSSVDRLRVYFNYSGGGTLHGDAEPEYTISANGQYIMVSQSATVIATGAGPWSMGLAVRLSNGTSAGTLINTMMRTTLIRR